MNCKPIIPPHEDLAIFTGTPFNLKSNPPGVPKKS
jgi:hypothetical protein